MANYFLSNNGTITDSNGNEIYKKKKKKGNNYIMSEDGHIRMNKESSNSKFLTFDNTNLPTSKNKIAESISYSKKLNNYKTGKFLTIDENKLSQNKYKIINDINFANRLNRNIENENFKDKKKLENIPVTKKEQEKQLLEFQNKYDSKLKKNKVNESRNKYTAFNRPQPMYKKVANEVEKVVSSLDDVASNSGIGAIQGFSNTGEYISSLNEILPKSIGNKVVSRILGIDSDSEVTKALNNVISNEVSNTNAHNKSLVQEFSDNVLNTEKAKKWRNETIQKNIENAEGNIGKYLAELAPSIRE